MVDNFVNSSFKWNYGVLILHNNRVIVDNFVKVVSSRIIAPILHNNRVIVDNLSSSRYN